MVKSKSTNRLAVEAIFAELEGLAAIHRKARRGYREVLRGLFGKARKIINEVQSSEKLTQRLLLKIRSQRKSKSRSSKMSLSAGVMEIIIGAGSRSDQKLAWKYGRVLDVLHKIPAENVAVEIKKRGGIERIYQESIDKKKISRGLEVKKGSISRAQSERSLLKSGATVGVPGSNKDRSFLAGRAMALRIARPRRCR